MNISHLAVSSRPQTGLDCQREDVPVIWHYLACSQLLRMKKAGGTGRAVWGCTLPAAAVQMQVKDSAVETFRAECESMIQRWAGSSFPPVPRELE